MVIDRICESRSVKKTPSKMITRRRLIARTSFSGPMVWLTKNILIRAMSVGNLPLQGTKLLVRMAINRSLGESMIRQFITAQALQPNPIHMVRTCFP